MNSESLLTLPSLSRPDQILLWVQIIFLWNVVNYVVSTDPVSRFVISDKIEAKRRQWYRNVGWRAGVFSIIVLFLPGFGFERIWPRLLLGITALSFTLALPLVRYKSAISKREILKKSLAEWEILMNIAFIGVTALIIATTSLAVGTSGTLIRIPSIPNHISSILVVSSGILFIIKGGTHIVRGILDKSDTLPELKEENDKKQSMTIAQQNDYTGQEIKIIDVKEYNRGRIIGNLERVLLLIVVLQGSYEAIGFIIAGKGLIRSKDFDSRDFTEYFLVGTFTSTTLAIVVGLILKFALSQLWQ